jgi:hypothetical protein
LFHFSAIAFTEIDEKRVLILFPDQSDLAAYPPTKKGIKAVLDAALIDNTDVNGDSIITI